MHHYCSDHPPTVSSLIIIRTRPECEPRSLISSLELAPAIIIQKCVSAKEGDRPSIVKSSPSAIR